MQRKVVIDTSIYIEIFNRDNYTDQINWFKNITYLTYPVFHELLIGAKTKPEVKSLQEWGNTFSELKRVIIPTESTLFQIGLVCQKLKSTGKLDPAFPKHYNDITIALLARQIGATVLTLNKKNFNIMQSVVDVPCEFL